MPRRLLSFVALAAILALVCVRLGFWQLSRLEEKRAANAEILSRFTAAPAALESLPADPARARWRRVTLTGSLDYAREAVLGHRTHKGSPGVHLFTPLRRPGVDTVVFVNRGWVYAPDGSTVDLARWQADAAPYGVGYVELFPDASARGPRNVATDTVLLRRLDRDVLARRVGAPVAPYYVVLLPDPEPLPDRDASIHPGRLSEPTLDEGSHLSYAIQWFSFAAIAVIGAAGLLVAERRKARGALPAP